MDPAQTLIRVLQHAYSGEQAAAYAYRGHWKSVSDPDEAERIRRIEDEEWHHRDLVGGLLRELGAAGLLESRNIVEYEDAARHAVASGRAPLIECLLSMAEVEWEHEAYFRARVLSHWGARLLPVWPAPPPRAAIRARYGVGAEGALPT